MIYIVYKTTNTANGKEYIGCHKTKDIDDGYLGSGRLLREAIVKYGIDSFRREIIAILDSEKEMFALEASIVDRNYVDRNDTYNLTLGGHGGFSHISKESMLERNLQINSHRDYECELYKENLKASLATVDYSERNKRRRETLVNRYGCVPSSFKGREHTDESKKKIGSANSKHQQGTGNSQYGTCWIYNLHLKKNQKIPKCDLDAWLDKGWHKGRKLKF
jgi:hypothetical protein